MFTPRPGTSNTLVTVPSNTARAEAPVLVCISMPSLSSITCATGCLCGPKYPVITPRSTGQGSRPLLASKELESACASGVRKISLGVAFGFTGAVLLAMGALLPVAGLVLGDVDGVLPVAGFVLVGVPDAPRVPEPVFTETPTLYYLTNIIVLLTVIKDMSTLSQKAEKLVASEIVRLGNTISERIRGGAKIYNYTIGDVDPKIFPIPDAYKAAIIDAYQHNYTNYPSAEGIVELRQSVAHFVKKHQGLDYALNEIQIASGGRPLIYSLFATLVNAGDKIIYAVPSWNNNHYVNINMGEHCVIEALPENNFMPSAADIAPHLDGAVLLCLCTPQNPTGTTLTREALEEICDLVLEENKKRAENGQRKLYVMYDQIYSLLTYGATQHHNP
ncbi:hypothetical protein OSTOST_13395, partial [Ostertagia ostertagi]